MFPKNITFSVDNDYLNKSRELKAIKDNFEKWINEYNNVRSISLRKSLKLIEKYKITFPRILAPNISIPLKLYRARVISANNPEDISKPKTFSYPPKVKAKPQRANVRGYPVFYGAFDGKTALEELRINGDPIKPGDKIYLSEWIIKDNVKYSLNYLTLSHLIGETYQFSEITKRVYSELRRIFFREDELFTNTQIYLFNKTSDLFLTRDQYPLSGIISHQILYNTPEVQGVKIDGILYPSCSNNFRSINCALHPNFVDRALELTCVKKISFKNFTSEGATVTGKYWGVNQKGKIIWKNYVSELMTKNYLIEIDLSNNWKEGEVEKADFFIDGQKSNFISFCEQYINKIDLSNKDIAQNYESIYKEGGMLLYQLKLMIKENRCYFKIDNRINYIKVVLLKIPIKAFSERITDNLVLNY